MRVAERHQGVGVGAGGCGTARLAADVAARQVRWPGQADARPRRGGGDEAFQTLPVRLVVMQDDDAIDVFALRVRTSAAA